jgi:transposase
MFDMTRMFNMIALLKNNRIRGEIAHSKAHRSHKYVNNAWSEISNSPPTLLFIPFHVPPH